MEIQCSLNNITNSCIKVPDWSKYEHHYQLTNQNQLVIDNQSFWLWWNDFSLFLTFALYMTICVICINFCYGFKNLTFLSQCCIIVQVSTKCILSWHAELYRFFLSMKVYRSFVLSCYLLFPSQPWMWALCMLIDGRTCKFSQWLE